MYKIRIKSAVHTIETDIRHSVVKLLEKKRRKTIKKETPSNKIILTEMCNNNNLVCIFNFIFLSNLYNCITKLNHYLKNPLRKTCKKFIKLN